MVDGSLAVVRRVGTSGYTYFWNPGKPSPFRWYLSRGFKTVEINASFYRFPQRSWINAWLKDSPADFDFSIKVHQSITHRSKLGPAASKLWEKFSRTLKPMKDKITFYLFQFPSYFKPTHENVLRIKSFVKDMSLENVAVFEFRHPGWWQLTNEIASCGGIFCSADAPGLPKEIVVSNDTIYLRMHGRTEWYAYCYTNEELLEVAGKLMKSRAERIYVYFNNDHGMLENALQMKKLING